MHDEGWGKEVVQTRKFGTACRWQEQSWLLFGQLGGAGLESEVQGQERINCASRELLIRMTGKTQKEEKMEKACGGGGWTGKEPLQKSEGGCWARLFRIR